MRVLCVCLGNICRSPMAEGVIRARAGAAGLAVEVDSAGTGAWHIGQPPDADGLRVALSRGYDNAAQRARQVRLADFDRFDLVLAMDTRNLADLRRLAPPGSAAELRLFHPAGQDIPDPYGFSDAVFHHALDLIEHATDALLAELTSTRD
ncbi:MAG: low molecular weight protein-tyrosine-phosphatase [Pseudomonadota bacterium]